FYHAAPTPRPTLANAVRFTRAAADASASGVRSHAQYAARRVARGVQRSGNTADVARKGRLNVANRRPKSGSHSDCYVDGKRKTYRLYRTGAKACADHPACGAT